jgi:hypothetical protein
MSMTIELGWWILPFLGSVVALGLAFLNVKPGGDGSGAIAIRMVNLLIIAVAIIAALSFWLVWAAVMR